MSAEKVSNKIEQLFMIKKTQKNRDFLNLIKNIYQNPTANIVLTYIVKD